MKPVHIIAGLGATVALHATGVARLRAPPGAHRGLLVAAWRWRDHGLAIPVSQSRDGDLVEGVLDGEGEVVIAGELSDGLVHGGPPLAGH